VSRRGPRVVVLSGGRHGGSRAADAEARSVVAALRATGFKAWGTVVGPALPRLVRTLTRRKPDVAFNLVRWPGRGAPGGMHVAAVLEWLGVPFAGPTAAARAVLDRSNLVLDRLRAAGVRAPDGTTPLPPGRAHVAIVAMPDPLPLQPPEGGIDEGTARLAASAFAALGARDFGEAELVVAPADAPRVFLFDATPDLHPEGLLARSFREVGPSYAELIAALARQALGRGPVT
jgi:hypothetical protein